MLLSYAFKKLISACQENYFALMQAVPYIRNKTFLLRISAIIKIWFNFCN